jgi:hypothetical protein
MTTARDRREIRLLDKLRNLGRAVSGYGSDGAVYPFRVEEFVQHLRGYGGLILAGAEQVPGIGNLAENLRSGFAVIAGGRASLDGTVPAADQAGDGQAQRILTDEMGRIWVTAWPVPPSTDPIVPQTVISRPSKGPILDYYGSPTAPIELPNSGSGDTIYCDNIEVTDANTVNVELYMYWRSELDAFTLLFNVGIGLESSGDGIYWSPISMVDRVELISPATLYRLDTGQTGLITPSTTGGYADATTTQNAPLLEDVLAALPAPISATTEPFVVQRAIRFRVDYELYVRLVLCPIYTEPSSGVVPGLAVRVNKATG